MRIDIPGIGLRQLLVAVALIGAAVTSSAEPTLEVAMTSTSFIGHAALGEIPVEKIGVVSLSARRDGKRIIVLASDSSGRVIGRGESVAGMTRTPLHLKTTQGLQKISVVWSGE